jgi:DNA polymerase-1
MKTLVLIDGHSLAYRMHFALEHTRMATSQKEPTWAVYGFFNALFSLLKQENPDAIALSFDVGKVTFRNDLYAEYKAHREAMPDPLRQQMAKIREGVERLGIPIYEEPGFEADDVIGTLSRQAADQGVLVRILTGDQDSFQLIDDGKVEVLIPSRTPREGLKTYTPEEVEKKLGVRPDQVIDFKGLKGDTSDNIPGVPGIGDKTAAKLLAEFGTLENLYANLDQVSSAKMREKLTTYQEQAFLSKRLATIDRHVPLSVNLDDCHLVIPDMKALIGFLESCEFRSFIQQAPSLLAPFLKGDQALGELEAAASSATPAPSTPKASAKGGRSKAPAQNGSGQLALLDAPAQTETALDEAASQMLLEALAVWRVPHRIIQTEADLAQWVATLQQAQVFALDLETTGLDVLSSQLVGMSFSVAPGVFLPVERPAVNVLGLQDYPTHFQAVLRTSDAPPHSEIPFETVYIPLLHEDVAGQCLATETVLNALRPVLASPNTVKVVHNAKFELNMMQTLGCPLGGPVLDTMLLSYVQNPDRRPGLKALALDLLHHRMQEITELIGSGRKEIPFSQVPMVEAAAYAACDAQATLELLAYFLETMPEGTHADRWTLFYEIENPLAAVLARMEREGVSLDVGYLKTLSQELDGKLAAVETAVYQLAGCQFNLNSPKQVGEVLFDKLGIRPLRKTPTKSGYSTDAKVLEALAEEHEVVQKLLDYRQLFKLKSTYIDNLPELIHPKTGRVHTSFNQTVTATGRLSSSNPNLQNIPIRSDVGRLIRQAFVPADRTQCFLMSADYSQIELRLLAHFSEDPFLVNAFNEGADIHAATAALVFNVPIDQVTKEMRYRAKTVNFGVIYGQSAHGLSQQLKITRAEAQQFIDLYFAKYHRVHEYIESVKAHAHETGVVETLCHRIRDLSDGLNSSVRSIREFSERAAFNTPLQGSAADLMKVAMIRLARHLEKEQLATRVILQVHDELVLEGPQAEAEKAEALVRWAMALDQPLRVPLEIDVYVGPSWMET